MDTPPIQLHNGAMLSLSIKNTPDHVVQKLRDRAVRHHRSLQGELMAIITAAADEDERRLTPLEILEEARKLGLSSTSESVAMIREDRDSDHGRN